MALHGEELMGAALRRAHTVRTDIEAIDGLHVDGHDDYVGPGLAADIDPLPVVIDLTGLAVSGYRAADWLREHHGVNAHLADHRRISAQLTHADDASTTGGLLAALRDLADRADELRPAPEVAVPSPGELRMDQSHLPRDAYFGSVEDVPLDGAVGRVAAEMVTPEGTRADSRPGSDRAPGTAACRLSSAAMSSQPRPSVDRSPGPVRPPLRLGGVPGRGRSVLPPAGAVLQITDQARYAPCDARQEEHAGQYQHANAVRLLPVLECADAGDGEDHDEYERRQGPWPRIGLRGLPESRVPVSGAPPGDR